MAMVPGRRLTEPPDLVTVGAIDRSAKSDIYRDAL
jgi:hypothetical protein